MTEFEKIADGINFTAISIAALNCLKGKVFLRDATEATATEISLTSLASGAELPFFHTHKKNEETYIILSGEGYFQVDDTSFPISCGSVIRIAPNGKRSMRNLSDKQMVYLVVQAKAGSLEEYAQADAEKVQHEKKW